MNVKCEHKWVDMEDGTNDRFCVRCRKFAMQAVAKLPSKSTVSPSSIDEAFNSMPNIEINQKIEDISKLLREEMERDMKKAMRSRGVF